MPPIKQTAMRCLLSSILLLLSLTAFGQAFTPRRPFIPQVAGASGPQSPTNFAGLAYYWVASDTLIQGTNVTITNWVDRIQGLIWTNETAGSRPVNSTNGIYFDGSTWMTNSGMILPTVSDNGWYFIIERTAQTDWWNTFLSRQGQDGGFVFGDGIHSPKYIALRGPSSTELAGSAVPTNKFMTLFLNAHSTAFTSQFATNGVAALQNFSDNTGPGNFTNVLGRNGTVAFGYRFTGYIQEIAVWTNQVTTNAWIPLNSYATNTYLYSP